jgi:signal peptidase I
MPPRTAHTRSFITWLWEWTKSIVVALVVWFFLRTFLVEAFRIPSGSMENTLLIGDFLFVNKALYGAEVPLVRAHLPAVREPQRNDILVFDSVEEEGLKVVKRLIGMPGDTLEMEGGVLYRNGKRVDEPYAVHGDPTRSEDPVQAKMAMAVAPPGPGDTADYHPDLQDWGRSWSPIRSS